MKRNASIWYEFHGGAPTGLVPVEPKFPRPMTRGHGDAKGFTLVEVLLAVVILSLGLTVILTATGRCLAVMKKAQTYQNAIWALNAAETEHPLTAVTNDIKSLEVSGAQYGEFTYTRTVGDDDNDDGLYPVTSRVSWTEKGHDSFEEVVCYVLYLEDKQKK